MSSNIQLIPPEQYKKYVMTNIVLLLQIHNQPVTYGLRNISDHDGITPLDRKQLL